MHLGQFVVIDLCVNNNENSSFNEPIPIISFGAVVEQRFSHNMVTVNIIINC